MKQGDRIEVSSKHWCRSNELGTIVEVLTKGKYLILFDKEGVGFDGGSMLQLTEKDFNLC